MKFLVLWRLEIRLWSDGMVQMALRQQDHFSSLGERGKVTARYHIPGRHGGY